jgi:FKBP-type peptidyl-prolyl cis-trans isomerase (trigger factor)
MVNQPQPNQNNPQDDKINYLADNTIEIEVVVPQEKIKEKYDQVLLEAQKTTEIKGFRKGKAPQDKAEKAIGKDSLYQKVINQLLPQIYQQATEKYHLKPVITPKAELVSAQEGKDWQVKFTTCELPKVNLNGYKEKIKNLNAKETIWTPEKGKQEKNDNKRSLAKDQKFQKTIDTLAETVRVTLPQILIENEVNQKLANLIEKTEKMGLSLEQYLGAIGKTVNSIKEEYQQESEKNWRLELALNEIADKENITVSEQDIDSALAKIENEKEKTQLSSQRYVLSSMLRRQKTLEFLQNLG